MNYFIRSTLLAVCLLGSTLALAADETVKVGVLDWQQLLTKAPQAEEASKRLEKEFQAPKDKMIKKQKEYQEKQQSLARNKDVMSATERATKEKELAKLETDLRRMDEEVRGDYTNRHREEMDSFIKVVRDAVDKLAAEEKFDLVIPQEATLFVAERMDITDKVLDRLSKLAKTAPKKSEKSDKAEKTDKQS